MINWENLEKKFRKKKNSRSNQQPEQIQNYGALSDSEGVDRTEYQNWSSLGFDKLEHRTLNAPPGLELMEG